MTHIYVATEGVYYIAHGEEAVHIGLLDAGLTVTSGQPIFELAADTSELLEKEIV